jgi:hypothetical protein
VCRCLPALLPARLRLHLQQAFCFEHAVYQPTNVQKLFAACLDDGRSQISADDLQHWEGVAVSVGMSVGVGGPVGGRVGRLVA